MLERAKEDNEFLLYLRSQSDETSDDQMRMPLKKLETSNKDDWKKIKLFIRFFKIFHNATLKLLRSQYITYNCFYIELIIIHDEIGVKCEDENFVIESMATNMRKKYIKY